MKLTTQQTETGFKPVSFTITCETQEDLDFWAAVFDYSPLAKAARAFGTNFPYLSSDIGVYDSTVHLTNKLESEL